MATRNVYLHLWSTFNIRPLVMKAEAKSTWIIASNGKENKNNSKYPPRKTNLRDGVTDSGFTSQSCQCHHCHGKIFNDVEKKSPLFLPLFDNIRKCGFQKDFRMGKGKPGVKRTQWESGCLQRVPPAGDIPLNFFSCIVLELKARLIQRKAVYMTLTYLQSNEEKN